MILVPQPPVKKVPASKGSVTASKKSSVNLMTQIMNKLGSEVNLTLKVGKQNEDGAFVDNQTVTYSVTIKRQVTLKSIEIKDEKGSAVAIPGFNIHPVAGFKFAHAVSHRDHRTGAFVPQTNFLIGIFRRNKGT